MVGMVGMVGMVRIRLRAPKFRFYHSDSTIPISTTPFRFYHSDFDNTRLVREAPAFCHVVTRPFQGNIARGHLFAATFGEAPAFCHVIKEPFLPCLLLIIEVMVLSNLVELKHQFKTFRGSHANKTQSPQSFKMFLQPTGVLEFWMRKGEWDGGWGSFPRTEGALEST